MDLASILRQLVEDFAPAEILESLGARFESKAESEDSTGDRRAAQYAELAERLFRLARRIKDLP